MDFARRSRWYADTPVANIDRLYDRFSGEIDSAVSFAAWVPSVSRVYQRVPRCAARHELAARGGDRHPDEDYRCRGSEVLTSTRAVTLGQLGTLVPGHRVRQRSAQTPLFAAPFGIRHRRFKDAGPTSSGLV